MTDILDVLRDVRIGEYRTVHYTIPQFDTLMNAKVLKPYRSSGTILYIGLDTVCVQEDGGHNKYVLTKYIEEIT